MAKVTETEKSRQGSSDGKHAGVYFRMVRVLIEDSDLPNGGVNWDTRSHEEQTRLFPSVTAIVRATNGFQWGATYPWNTNAAAVGWTIAEVVNPRHFIVAVEYEVPIGGTIGTGIPPGWSFELNGTTQPEFLAQELPDPPNSRGRGISELSEPQIIGPPVFEPINLNQQLLTNSDFKYTDSKGDVVWLRKTEKRHRDGTTVQTPFATATLSRRVRNFTISRIGFWLLNLGKVNNVQYLGAPPRFLRYKSLIARPEQGSLQNEAATGLVWFLQHTFEWHAKEVTPHQITWEHRFADGGAAFVTDATGKPVVEDFRVANEFYPGILFTLT